MFINDTPIEPILLLLCVCTGSGFIRQDTVQMHTLSFQHKTLLLKLFICMSHTNWVEYSEIETDLHNARLIGPRWLMVAHSSRCILQVLFMLILMYSGDGAAESAVTVDM